MAKLDRCAACGGFVAKHAASCPHCGGRPARPLRLGAIGGALGGGALAFTLMACYGAAPPPRICPNGSPDCKNKPDAPPPAAADAGVTADGGR